MGGSKKPYSEVPSLELKGAKGHVSLDVTAHDLDILRELNAVPGSRGGELLIQGEVSAHNAGLFKPVSSTCPTSACASNNARDHINDLADRPQNHGCSRHGFGHNWRFDVTCDECVSSSFHL